MDEFTGLNYNYYGTSHPSEVTSIAVMEVTPNSPDSSTLGMVIKQITVPHILYKDSSMKGKAFRHFYLRKYSFLTENSKFTNFTIGGLLAGPHRSPLIQRSCFTGYSPKIIIIRDLSTYWYPRNYQLAPSVGRDCFTVYFSVTKGWWFGLDRGLLAQAIREATTLIAIASLHRSCRHHLSNMRNLWWPLWRSWLAKTKS